MNRNARNANKLSKQETKILLSLYREWRHENGQQRRELLNARDRAFESAEARREYYQTFFIFLVDDVLRLGREFLSSDWLLFPDVQSLYEHMAQSGSGTMEHTDQAELRAFAEAIQAPNEIFPSCVRPDADHVSRTHILWLVCERILGEREMYGRCGKDTHASVKADLAFAADIELASAGFQAVDYRNPLDGYLAFSLYRKLKKTAKS